MRLFAKTNTKPTPSRKLLCQLAVLIVVKITILMTIWYVLIKDHKMQGHTEATADYFLTPGATPQKQVVPRSPWE